MSRPKLSQHDWDLCKKISTLFRLSTGSAKRPRLKFKAPTRITPVTTGVSSSQKENDRVVQNFDLESNQFESDICDFMDRMDEADQGSVED